MPHCRKVTQRSYRDYCVETIVESKWDRGRRRFWEHPLQVEKHNDCFTSLLRGPEKEVYQKVRSGYTVVFGTIVVGT